MSVISGSDSYYWFVHSHVIIRTWTNENE